jgi:hypothetical protein
MEDYCKLIVITFDLAQKKRDFRLLDPNSNEMLQLRNDDCCFPGGQQAQKIIGGDLIK